MLTIDPIYIVVHKHEPAHFSFLNPHRAWDGFVLLTEGTAVHTDAHGDVHQVSAGDLMLLRRGDRYRFDADAPCAYITSAFDFAPSCTPLLNDLPPVIVCDEPQLQLIRQAAQQWEMQTWDSAIACQIALQQLYLGLLQRTHAEHTSYDPITARAVTYIHRHFKTAFSIAELATYCGVSASYLRAQFHRSTGESVLAYRDRLRISAACEMLRSGVFSVREVAQALGYCDVYHFSRVFTAQTHCPPGRYRRAN